MASEIQKEPSGLEVQSLDEVLHLAKLEDSQVFSDPNDFSGSGEAVLLQDIAPGPMDSNNLTCDIPDQVEDSEDDGTVRKGKNSGGHCQQKKRFACAVCGKSLSSKKSLQSHERTHTQEKPFACRICGKSFAHSSNLSRHKLIHTGEKPFACRICGKSSGHLSCHKLTHTGEKPFACRICGKSFARKGDLSTHKLTHTGEKPYACRFCGKSFAQSRYLSTHKSTHTGEKPFAFRICGKSFAQGKNLSRHKTLFLDPWTMITKHATYLIGLRSVRTTALSEMERIQVIANRRNALLALYAANLSKAKRAFGLTSALTQERKPSLAGFSQADTHWGETLCLQDLWKSIRTEYPFVHAFVDAYWRETLCLQDLWRIIRTELPFIQPQADTHWGETLCLQD
ncbi:unnamed protein product, partial [Cyprideis torosa]